MEILRPQDLIVVLKLVANPSHRNWTYAELSKELGLSASQIFRSVSRAEASRLLQASIMSLSSGSKTSSFSPRPNFANIREFLVHGAKYSFPVEHSGMSRGLPTAYAAPPLAQHIAPSSELPPVWPHAEGKVRGIGFSPLYKNAPMASLRDHKLYELLTLVDSIRDGRARECEIAVHELTQRLSV